MSFYLGWIYKKGQRTKIFFQVSTCFSNIFTQHMFFPEICFASTISEPEFTVCDEMIRNETQTATPPTFKQQKSK